VAGLRCLLDDSVILVDDPPLSGLLARSAPQSLPDSDPTVDRDVDRGRRNHLDLAWHRSL